MLTPARFSGNPQSSSENKNNDYLAGEKKQKQKQKQKQNKKHDIYHPWHFQVRFFLNDDRSIGNGIVLQLWFGMSRIQEHETATKRRSNVQFTRQSSLFRQLFVN